MAKTAGKDEEKSARGAFAWARKVDDVVFMVEKSIITFALVTITVVVFVDVIARRITAPDSKIGRLLSRIAGIDDYDTLLWVDANVAPWVTLVLALLTIGFGFYSSRRFGRMAKKSEGRVDMKREVGLAAGTAVVGVALGYGFSVVFEALESWMVYGGTFAAATAGFVVYQVRRRVDGWKVRAFVGGAAGAVLVYFCLPLHVMYEGAEPISYVPEQYTWSKKVSLMLLLWVGILSASICVYVGKHIRMSAAQQLVPPKVRRWLNGSGYLAAAAFCGMMTYLGFLYIVFPTGSDEDYLTEIFTFEGTRYVFGTQGMIGSGARLEGTEIPAWFGILSAPVGFGIATLRFVAAGVSAFLGGSYGESAADEAMEEAEQAARGADEQQVPPAKEDEEEE